MSASKTKEPRTQTTTSFWTKFIDTVNQSIQAAKIVMQIVIGLGLFLLAAYVFMNPLLTDGGWIFGIGFYELLLLVFGTVFFLMAYKNIQATEVIY